MDFARKILGKYGWKDGDGLGKNNTGIAKPLRATLKFDNAGFGADQAASDFNNHWWERVFNDAASNVEVKKDGESITMDLKDDEDGVEISTKGFSMKKLKKAKESRGPHKEKNAGADYGNFLQAATLTNTGDEIENPDRIQTGCIEVNKVKVLTDEELFKACGGRTAHKGARHGLKLSGKLSRIEQQEEELLARMMAKRNCVIEDSKKKIKVNENAIQGAAIIDPSEDNLKSTKTKKRKQIVELAQEGLEVPVKKKKRNKEKKDETSAMEVSLVIADIDENENHSKKKKNKHRVPEISQIPDDVKEDTMPIKIKKKKKKYAKEKAFSTETDDATNKCIKKKKKSQNNSKSHDE